MFKNCFLSILIAYGTLTLVGCSTGKTQALSSIPGVSSGVWMTINEDDSVTLTGNVSHSHEKVLVEKYVRGELGYTDIENLITSN